MTVRCYRANELYHYGVLGMKWGVRRFQKKNGSLTSAGKERYQENEKKRNLPKGLHLTEKQKKAIKIGTAVAASALIAYGGYKLYESGKLDGIIQKGEMKVKGLLDNNTASDKMLSELKTFKKLERKESLEETISKIKGLSRKVCK